MTKTLKARYTLEFKREAVRLVQAGQNIASAARALGVVDQTLYNWVKAQRASKLKGANSKPVSAEQMEISRLGAELARANMERDILGKATAYFAKGLSRSTPLLVPPRSMANISAVPRRSRACRWLPRARYTQRQQRAKAPPQR